jgi:hypothetical protein
LWPTSNQPVKLLWRILNAILRFFWISSWP